MKIVPRLIFAAVTLGAIAMGGAFPAQASGATVAPGASSSHPYSSPVWWPLASGGSKGLLMGCYKDNPDCDAPHNGYLLDLVGTANDNSQKVYAMGAGIVHIGASGQSCHPGRTDRGDFIEIDHGGGVVSYYAHLGSHFLVRNGEYVSARTAIGYLGNSGNGNCKRYPGTRYTMIAVKNGRTYTDMSHLYTCVGGHRENWPSQLPGRGYGNWNSVPNKHPLPASDAARTCEPALPHTAPRPSSVRLRADGASTVKGYWARTPKGYGVTSERVQLDIYYPSDHAWYQYRVHWKSVSSTATTFTHLKANHRYRMQVIDSSSGNYSVGSYRAYAATSKAKH